MNSIEVLAQRQLEGWAPGDDDGNKLYAAVDGGGMAGVVSLGAVHQLGEMGLLDHFDGFAGSSAGSLNAAYGMTGRALQGREIYVDYLPDNKFMRWWRPSTGAICDMDVTISVPLPFADMQVLGKAVKNFRPLDMEMVINDSRELLLGVSDLREAMARMFINHDFKDKPDEFLRTLLEGASLPFGMTGNRWEQSSRYGDTGLYWPTTDTTIARRRGATHVLSLASGQQPKRATSTTQRAADFIQARFCENQSRGGGEVSRDANRYRDFVMGRFASSQSVEIENTTVTRIYPEGEKLPGRQTQNKKLLAKGFEAGRQGIINNLANNPEVAQAH